ncbi:MAG: rhodanese-like domain-containing protein [Cellulosilyticum sp.]|nr:rhodanese-like domain-containing protein [Cellulosilyticum sp.]
MMEELKPISVEQVKQDLEEGKEFILLDVRTPEEFEEGHIEGAINIPLKDLVYDVENEIPEKEETIYLYCRSGVRVLTAGHILYDLGYENVYNMGGILSWPYEIVKG